MKYFTSLDPDLTALANQLEYTPFEMSEEEYETFAELQKTDTLQSVSAFLGGRTFRVRLCIGGKQHIIGICRKGPHAARFADMARLFFWPYRLRDKRFPEDRDFNFGLEATEQALKENDNAAGLLEKILDHLIKIARLPVVTERSEAERLERKSLRDTRRTVRGELLYIHEESMKKTMALEQQLGTLQKALEANLSAGAHSFDQIKQAFQQVSERLAAVEALIIKNSLEVSSQATDIKGSEI